MSPEDRAWLAGILEGLAGREVDPRLIDRIITRCEGARTPPTYPVIQDPTVESGSTTQVAPAFKPATSITEMKAQLAAAPGKRPGKKKTVNTTEVADEPPYNAADKLGEFDAADAVVRLG